MLNPTHRNLLIGTVLAVLGVAVSAAENTYDIHVNGLACPFCVYGLERSVGRIDGVEAVAVNLSTGLIRITVREDMMLDEVQVHETVEDAGFTVESVEIVVPSVSQIP